jgi:hypothetical protein
MMVYNLEYSAQHEKNSNFFYCTHTMINGFLEIQCLEFPL